MNQLYRTLYTKLLQHSINASKSPLNTVTSKAEWGCCIGGLAIVDLDLSSCVNTVCNDLLEEHHIVPFEFFHPKTQKCVLEKIPTLTFFCDPYKPLQWPGSK